MTDQTETTTATSPKHYDLLIRAVRHLLKDHALAGGSGAAASVDLYNKLDREMFSVAVFGKVLTEEEWATHFPGSGPAVAGNGADGPAGDGRRA